MNLDDITFFASMTNTDGPINVKQSLYDKYIHTAQRHNPSADISHTIPVLLNKTHVTVTLNGVIKSISINDFRLLISSLTGESETNVPPLALPFGCFLFRMTNGIISMNCYYPGRIVDIHFDKGDKRIDKLTIPLPNIIIAYSLKLANKDEWNVTDARYFCTPKNVTQLPDNKFIDNIDPTNGI